MIGFPRVLRLAALPFAAAAVLVAAAPSEGTAIRAATDITSGTSTVSKVIRVHGQDVRIVLTVQNFLETATGPGPLASVVTVDLDGNGANTFPPNIVATRVRLRRVGSPHRLYQPRLESQAVIQSLPAHSSFASAEALRLVAGTRFDTAVRLEIDGERRIVPMGQVRVRSPFIILSPLD
jgi:hypothetical protein